MDTKKMIETNPLLRKIADCREIFWVNPKAAPPKHGDHAKAQAFETPGEKNAGVQGTSGDSKVQTVDVSIDDADARLLRFAPFIRKMFTDTEDGIIESELKEI